MNKGPKPLRRGGKVAMMSDLIQRTLETEKEDKEFFLITANRRGIVHADLVHHMAVIEGDVRVQEWFSPLTLSDLEENKHVTLVIWDPKIQQGYQLEGKWKELKEQAPLGDHLPNKEELFPQVAWDLRIAIQSVMPFKSHEKKII